MCFVSQKEVKGQAIEKFLSEHPVPKFSKLYKDILDEIDEANMVLEEQVWM